GRAVAHAAAGARIEEALALDAPAPSALLLSGNVAADPLAIVSAASVGVLAVVCRADAHMHGARRHCIEHSLAFRAPAPAGLGAGGLGDTGNADTGEDRNASQGE